jgi:hypothetical protein
MTISWQNESGQKLKIMCIDVNFEGKGRSYACMCSGGKQPVHLNADNLVNVEISDLLI